MGSFLDVSELSTGIARQVMQVYKCCTQDPHMSANLPHLLDDTDAAFRELGASGVMEPMLVVPRLIYQLTHRMVGTHDIAGNPDLVNKTLAIYRVLEEDSVMDVLYPLLPTPSKLRRLVGYARLAYIMKKVLRDRRKSGRFERDAMQLMIDQGCSDSIITLVRADLYPALRQTFKLPLP